VGILLYLYNIIVQNIANLYLDIHTVKVTLWLTVSQSVWLGIEHPCGICDQILLPVGMLLSEICGLVSVGRPLWWEDGSATCSVITQWPESCKTHNRTLLSHLRLPQPGRPGFNIYIPQEQGGPVIPPGTGYIDIHTHTYVCVCVCVCVCMYIKCTFRRSCVRPFKCLNCRGSVIYL
jgi:hypothetical protein